MYQSIAIEPENNESFIAAMFAPIAAEVQLGQFCTDPSSNDSSPNCHPWLRQLVSDLAALANCHCDCRWLLDVIATPIAILRTIALLTSLVLLTSSYY